MRVRVVEPFRSLFYTPQFVALHGGEFAREGLDVAVGTASEAGGTVTALLQGTADVALGGLMRSLELVDRGGGFLPHFAEVNRRNGFFLLSREPRPGFAWSDLAGRTAISFAGAPTPYYCLLAVLRRHGVDPAGVRFVRDLHGAEAVQALGEGRGDFLEVGQPATEELLAAGAHLVASMGQATGAVPFSSYMTTPARLRGEAGMLVAFTRALARAQRWMAGHQAAEIADLIAPSFPDIAPAIRSRAVERYLHQDTWATEPRLGRPGFDALQAILLGGGFIHRHHRYEDLVDVAIAERALATLGCAIRGLMIGSRRPACR